jgi:hypothetical protein
MGKMRISGIPYRSGEVADVFRVPGELRVRQRVAESNVLVVLTTPKICWSSLDMS